MTAMCHPLTDDHAASLLSRATQALCVRPNETQADYDERAQHLAHTALDLAPRDSLELMLAILVAGHFDLALDAMRDVHAAESDADKRRAKASVATLERGMLSMVRQLRTEQKRPLEPTEAPAAAATQTETPAPAPPAHAPAERAPPKPNNDGPASATAPLPPLTPSNRTRLNNGVAALPLMPPAFAAGGRFQPAMASQTSP